MASSDQRAYVYLQLPQSLEVVTAGFFELDFRQGVPTGSFVYNPTYLQRPDAVPLEPYELPLAPRRTQTVKLKGIFGALRDASPDAWGRRIIEKHTGRTDLTEVDYLLHSPQDRAGALCFGRDKAPPAPVRKFNQVIQLRARSRRPSSSRMTNPQASLAFQSSCLNSCNPAPRWGVRGRRMWSRTA